jgi:hypothetical protein
MTAPQPNARRNRLWAEGALFLVSFLWVLRPIWSIDIFFHVAIGRELLANGIPSTDVFSAAHPDAPWTPFQVGYALFVHGIDLIGGLDLLRLVHSLLLGTTVVLLWRRIRGTTQSAWGALLLLALFFLLFEERIRLRPHLFNLLFEVTVLLPFAAGAWRKSPRTWRVVILLVSFAWTFMHAMGSLWLLCVVGAVAVAGANAKERRFGVVACLLAFVGIVASPGAVAGIIHVISISGDWATFVPELAPSWIWFQYGSPYGIIAGCAPWAAVLAVIYAVARNPARERWATIIAAAGLAFGAVWMVRLTYYSVFVFILLAPELTPLYDGIRQRWGNLRFRFSHAILLVIVCLCAVLASQRIPPTVKRGVNPWTTTLDPGYFPVDEVEALKRAKVGTRIFNASVWGGYLLYHLYPQARVLTDGRITFLNDVKDTLKHSNRRSKRLYVANMAHVNWKIDLLVWSPGMMKPNRHWDLILKGKTAEIWAPRGAIADRYRAALKPTVTQAP